LAKLSLKEYNDAIQDFNKAIEIHPHFYTYYSRGLTKAVLKDYNGAIQDFNKAIHYNNKVPEAYYNRGLAKFDKGDKNGSCIDMKKAVELGVLKAYDFIKDHCI
jgi:tetratricopeptide (TPR) repeat protein